VATGPFLCHPEALEGIVILSRSKAYDVAVIGLGGMGSSALAHCARSGMRAIGFEQYGPLHDRGASSGRSRMIRKAYYEQPHYVPLLLRAYDAWRELERESGAQLLHITGLLMIGGERDAIVSGALQSAAEYALPVEELDVRQIRERFSMFAVRDGERAVYEKDGGFIVPESAIEAYLRIAERHGATMEFDSAASVDRALEQAASVVVCAGPWLEDANLGIPIEVERNVQHWFAPQTGDFAIGRCPSFLIERDQWAYPLYGFPDYGFGIKAAFHGSGQSTHANELDREVRKTDIEPVRAAMQQAMPGSAGAYIEGKACMYALTPDRHFVISPHPKDPRVIVAGGFSGHGFKFVPVVGEIISRMIAGMAPAYEIEFLSAARF
jgi:sarcosine oxidase